MTEPETAQEPSELMKLAQNMMGAAARADASLESFHGSLENMLEAVHGLVQYLVTENAQLQSELYEANGRLAGLEK